jgi:murein endopeptidase
MGYVIKTTNKSGFYRIPDRGLGYYLGREAAGRLWGQAFLILFLIELGERWFALNGYDPFGIGDIAEEDGRPMPDHNSHRFGSAVDLFIFHQDGLQRNDSVNAVSVLDPTTYDPNLTLQFVRLIKEFSARYGMQQILFNDDDVNKTVNAEVPGHPPVLHDSTTRNSKNQHFDHVHVTFNGINQYKNQQIIEILESKSLPFSPTRCNRYGLP